MTLVRIHLVARVASALLAGLTLYSAELALALTCIRIVADRYDPRLLLARSRAAAGPPSIGCFVGGDPRQQPSSFALASRDEFAL